MFNEFILYAAMSGAFSFIMAWAVSKEAGLSGIISVILGIIFILFVFPEPQSAKDFADVANNLTLLITKLIWGGGWFAGTYASFWLMTKRT